MTSSPTKLTTGGLPPWQGEVLVVEDDGDLRDTTVEFLNVAGFTAAGVSNGAEALGFLARGPVGVILLDLRMPVLNGWEFLDRRNADPKLSTIPVIVLSGELVDLALAGEVSAWITKPFEEGVLLGAIATALRGLSEEDDDAPSRRGN